MAFRITKDCGAGWDECLRTNAASWGVSESQYRYAKSIEPGDVFLHFIDRARVWAGYSTVLGPIEDNDDPVKEYRDALPSIVRIKRGIWLEMALCHTTFTIPDLSPKKFHRQPSFSSIDPDDAKLIMAAISSANTAQPIADEAFKRNWNAGADRYWWVIARKLSGGACWLCKDTVDAWIARSKAVLTKDEIESVRHRFLDVAHIKAKSDGGPITPDNVRTLCPSCHRIVDRLSPARCKELLNSQ